MNGNIVIFIGCCELGFKLEVNGEVIEFVVDGLFLIFQVVFEIGQVLFVFCV